MDQDANLILLQPERAGDVRVEHVVEDLDLHEMVAAAERATLLAAALDGVVGDVVGFGPVDAAVGFHVGQVGRDAEAPADDITRPFSQERLHLLVGELVSASAPDPGRDCVEQGADQLADLILYVAVEEARADEAHAAVDVITDPARANDAPFCRVGRRNAPDAEAVTPVDVRHGGTGADDAGQIRDIGDLIRGLVLLELFQQLIVGVDYARNAHPRLVAARDADAVVVDALEWAAVGLFLHPGQLGRLIGPIGPIGPMNRLLGSY